MTGPYHSISSLDKVLAKHSDFKSSVIENKNIFQKKMYNLLTVPIKYQPLLCTHVKSKIKSKNNKVILYKPRNDIGGSVVCHLGEAHLKKLARGKIFNNLKISI